MSANRYLLGAHVLGGSPAEGALIPTDDALAEQAAQEVNAVLAQHATPAVLPSEIEDVSDEDWTKWVQAMKVGEPTTITDSGALGLFGIKPRRLEDLGLMKNVEPFNERRRMKWDGDWVPPMTREAFLGNPSIQYRLLAISTRLYCQALADGEIRWPNSDDVTLSGALALLNKCGPRVLEDWADASRRKPSTEELFKATNGLF